MRPDFVIRSYLELSESEATAGADATVVLKGRASDDRPQLVDGAGSDGGSLCAACQPAGDLLAGLLYRNRCQNQPITLRISSLQFQLPKRVSPGRSVSGPDVANPCGNLYSKISPHCPFAVCRFVCRVIVGLEEFCSRLWGICWLCLIAWIRGGLGQQFDCKFVGGHHGDATEGLTIVPVVRSLPCC